MNGKMSAVLLAGTLALGLSGVVRAADDIWDLEAVDADGVACDPRVGGDPTDASSWVVVEGIALNSSSELLPGTMWQVYVQGESPDAGGIAAWQGAWFNPPGWPWPPFPNVVAGDRIRIEGLIADHNGKVNINARHSSDPGMQFAVTVLQAGVGMPEPQEIADIAACDFFDQTRATGGEQYQAQWCQLNDVWITSGTWGAGQTVTVTDASGQTLDLLLSGPGDFDSHSEPNGPFRVVGVFDQEDDTSPYHGAYRLWVKNYADLFKTLVVDVTSRHSGGVWYCDVQPVDAETGRFAADTDEVTLLAVPSAAGRFERWLIYDANYPGDANHAVEDTNNIITISFGNDTYREVEAVFECGSGAAAPFLPVMCGILGMFAVLRRRA